MKILHISETIKGGVGTVIHQLLEYQLLSDEIDDAICLVPYEQSDILSGIDEDKIFTYKRSGRNLRSLLKLLFASDKIIQSYKPDIIHLHSTFAGLLCRLLMLKYTFKKNKPVVIYCPHAFPFLMKQNAFRRIIFIYTERALSYLTNTIICVGKYEFEEAVNAGIPSKKLKLVYNGVSSHDSDSE